jgi:Zn-dependent protease/CBS domain-containing protein
VVSSVVKNAKVAFVENSSDSSTIRIVHRHMQGSIPLFRIAGIPVEINYSWILIFVLVAANLAAGWFPATQPARSTAFYYALGALGALLLFVCVLGHELSHSLIARAGGMTVRGIVLHVFGGVSLINEDHYRPALELRVAIAGPLLSIFLGFLFFMIRTYIFPESGTTGHSLFTYLYFINFVLAIFNLLPGFPLDGGRVLRSVLTLWKKDFVKATRIATRVGVILAFLLMAWGAVAVLRGNFGGLWTILIGIFLKDAAEMSYKQVQMQNVFRGGRIDEIMQRNPVIIPPDITIQQLIDDYFWRYHYGSFPVGQPNDAALGIITFTDVKKIPPEKRQELLVRDVMNPIRAELRTSPEEPILSAFEKATQNGVGRLIVVDPRDHVLGYLSLRDIARAFHHRNQLTGELGT